MATKSIPLWSFCFHQSDQFQLRCCSILMSKKLQMSCFVETSTMTGGRKNLLFSLLMLLQNPKSDDEPQGGSTSNPDPLLQSRTTTKSLNYNHIKTTDPMFFWWKKSPMNSPIAFRVCNLNIFAIEISQSKICSFKSVQIIQPFYFSVKARSFV